MSAVGVGFFIVFGLIMTVCIVYPMVTNSDQTEDW